MDDEPKFIFKVVIGLRHIDTLTTEEITLLDAYYTYNELISNLRRIKAELEELTEVKK